MKYFKNIIPAARNRIFTDTRFRVKVEHLKYIDMYFHSVVISWKKKSLVIMNRTFCKIKAIKFICFLRYIHIYVYPKTFPYICSKHSGHREHWAQLSTYISSAFRLGTLSSPTSISKFGWQKPARHQYYF